VEVRKKYQDALRELTERLLAIRIFDPDGRPSFEFQSYSIITSVLESAIDFHPEIPDADRPWVLRAGVSNACKEKDLTPTALEQHLKNAEREYLRTPLKDYTLATAFGIRAYRGLKTVSINGVRISFASSLPRRFDRSEIAYRLDQSVSDCPSDILQVLARVSARTPNAAFNQAQTAVDLIRALWNLVLNRGTRRISLFQTGTPKPVNPILPGALHTLHEPGGALIKDVFWVETHPLESSRVYGVGENWHLVQKRSLKLRSKLRALSYGDEIEKAIVRYGRALDEADARSSFNRVWSVLEYLTNSIGAYDTLISRSSFLATDRERTLVRMILQHLRDVRNAVVHADEERSNMNAYLYELKFITEWLIFFHLNEGKLFGSRARAAEYLDTPTDRRLLLERIGDYRRALRRR
jgi:hypothetical protein